MTMMTIQSQVGMWIPPFVWGVRRLYDELTLIRKSAGGGRRSRSWLTQEVGLRLLEAVIGAS